MNKNTKVKILLSVIISILILCFVFLNNKKNTLISQEATLIIKSNGEAYEYNDIQCIIKYNVVFIPMDEVFSALFKEKYVSNNYSQKIEYNGMKIEINNNKINILDIDKGEVIDDSVEVEIEEENEIKYIPTYLISNFPNINVKIDNKEIYTSSNYISSLNAISNEKKEHKIVIYIKDDENLEENYKGESLGSLWREEALKRIEKYRKKEIRLEIKNQNLNSLYKSNVNIKMEKNEFKFGTAIRDKDINETFNKYFSLILSENGNKWSYISNNGYEVADYVYSYGVNNKLNIKGHNLWWDYVYSKGLDSLIESQNDKDITFSYINQKYNNNEIDKEKANQLIEELIQKFENIVFLHIRDEMDRYPLISEWDVVNEPINYQYFKYYLYDKNLLKDSNFKDNIYKKNVKYTGNNKYYEFLAKCFDEAREENVNAKLILNDDKINGQNSIKTIENFIDIVKNIKQRTNNLNSIGIQYHANNYYKMSPQSYYNLINKVIESTGINDVVISEYDNYLKEKNDKYTVSEKNIKANYLRDSLIMAYSNQKISEFDFWVYYSGNIKSEERKAYEETVYPWLNYTEEGTAGEDGYSTRLYKGTYTATITLPNGKKKEVEFEVSDDSSDTIDIIIDSEITDVKLKQKPSKTKYYKNDILDLTDGILEVAYDDGTTKEFLMTEVDATVTGFESNKLGVQTVKLEYEGHTIKFDIYVEEKEEVLIAQNIEKIKQNNIEIKNKYQFIFDNESILNKYNLIITNLENLEKDIKSNVINNEKINNTYKSEYDFILVIINEYNNSKLSISQNNLQQIINDIISTSSKYIDLYKYYVNNDPIENEIIVSKINIAINKYNANLDIEIPLVDELIKEVKDIYTNNLDSENVYKNYLNKQRILNTCEIIETMQDKEILKKAQEESTKIKIAYNYDSNIITNQVVKAQVYLPSDKCVIMDNAENKPYKFDMNGSRRITINIRGYEYSYEIKVINIDKISPIINGVVDGKLYTSKVTPTITDENLDTIKLTLNGEEVKNFKSGTTLTEEGFYILTAIDKAGNEAQTLFQIMENNNQNYIIQDNIIKNISEQTKKSDFDNKLKLGLTYKITRNDEEINETDNIATGDILTTSAGDKYTLIVAGDINKDGKVDLKDLIKIRKSILDDSNIETNEALAADCNSDGKINLKDLVKIRLMILNRDATK